MNPSTHDSTTSFPQAAADAGAPRAPGATSVDGREIATALQATLNPLWVINIGMGIFFCMAAALLAKG